MPNIRNIAWKQRPNLTPVGTIIVADLAPAIRVIHTGAFPPLRIILDPIGLIRHKQRGFNGTQHARQSNRCLPSNRRSPNCEVGVWGAGGAASSSHNPSVASCAANSRASSSSSKPVKPKSQPRFFRSRSSRPSRSTEPVAKGFVRSLPPSEASVKNTNNMGRGDRDSESVNEQSRNAGRKLNSEVTKVSD